MNQEKAKELANVLRNVVVQSYDLSKDIRTELSKDIRTEQTIILDEYFFKKFMLNGMSKFNETLDKIILAEENFEEIGSSTITIHPSVSEKIFRDIFEIYTMGRNIDDYLEKTGEKTYRTFKGNIVKFIH